MVPSLLAEAEKVMRTNQRLSATLRRLLDLRAASDRQRVARVIGEIRTLAAQLADSAPLDEVGATVDVGVGIALPFSRSFWSPATTFEGSSEPLREQCVDDARRLEAFRQLALLHRLDWRAMRDHVDSITRRMGPVSLRQIVAEFPPSAGVVELLGYLQIARDDGHVVSPDKTEEITLAPDNPMGQPRRITVPLIVFLSPQEKDYAAATRI